MFRTVARAKQAMTREECIALLQSEKRGILSVLGDQGYPYGMPLNHYYCPEDGRLYFHCGKAGHRMDALGACDRVSYCVMDPGSRDPGDWALRFRSVIVFGRVEFLEDRGRIYEICTRLSRQFTLDEAYIAEEIRRFGPATCVFSITPEHITGKRVREA